MGSGVEISPKEFCSMVLRQHASGEKVVSHYASSTGRDFYPDILKEEWRTAVLKIMSNFQCTVNFYQPCWMDDWDFCSVWHGAQPYRR